MAAMNDVLLACTIDDIDLLKRGLSKGISPNSRTNEGLNGLHLTAKYGMFDCMKYLLENNLNSVNSRVKSTGDTALHCVLAGNLNGKRTVKLLRLLLDNGGELDRQNKAGQVPLHFAARYGHIKCLKLLLDNGADINKTDFDGSTPYDLACLHGQYECARLLRSLHWAKKKDKDLDTTLKEEHIQKTREKEYLALHSRLRMEAAEYAYEEWLEQKDIPRSQTPSACEERREVRSRASQKSVSCTSCTRSRASSKQQSATTKTPKANCTIKVNPHQQAHNIQAVGTPKKLYPYTNYPPKHLRCSSASHSKTKSAVRSGRRSRTTVQNTSQSEPILVTQTSTNKTNSTSSADSSQTSLVPASVVDEKVIENKTISEESSNEIAVFNLKSETSTGQFSSQDEDEEEFLFHDVGHTNNLEALALPNLITKDKTQGELIQLLQSLGEKESGPRDFTRSHSLHVRRNSAHGGTHRRMLSLGALPEGRMVTSYSDEELSVEPSQILDESFLEEFVKTFSSSQEASEERMAPKIGWEDNQNKNDIPLVAISDVQNAISRRSSLTLPLSDLHKNSPNSRSDQTLKVVNMEWDAKLGCVQSVITESPLTPPPDTHQRKLLSPRLSPPLASMRHSPVEYS